MKIHLLLWVLTLRAQFQFISGLKLVDNGYEDLYIVIEENIQESDELLDRIKTIFVEASALLYTATQRRTYFKSVKVIVPKTWPKQSSFSSVSDLSSSTSYIKIGDTSMVMPATYGNEGCGQEGMYMYLPYKEFVLQYGKTLWGQHASVIVHEWGHLRWGLKDEYPTPMKGPSKEGTSSSVNNAAGKIDRTDGVTIHFYQEDGKWKQAGCVRDLKGYATTASCSTGLVTGNCDQENVGVMIDCKFCPEMTQTVNASIMGYQYIPSLVEFCDKDEPATPEYKRHNSDSTNAQNTHCDKKSSWEIMREHMDFKGDNSPPLEDKNPPSTEFQFLQAFGKVIVFVLDISGSMAGYRINTLYKTASHVIATVLPLGTWTSIVSFESDAEVRSNLVQISSNATRDFLISKLPNTTAGSTCISCGLYKAFEVLKGFAELDTTEETEIILISDGQNNVGTLGDVTKTFVDAGVVIHSVTVTETADQILVDLAKKTRGRLFENDAKNLSRLIDMFSDIISGGPIPDSNCQITVKNEQIATTPNAPTNVPFIIDDGMGKDTTISIISNEKINLGVLITGPINATLSQTAIQSQTVSVNIPGTSEILAASDISFLMPLSVILFRDKRAEVTRRGTLVLADKYKGQYIAEVTSSINSSLTAIITSKPVSTSAEVIRAVVRLSTDTLNFDDTKNFPILYVYLSKGELRVKKATVEAIVEDPHGYQTCTLTPMDNGVDPDKKSDDGTYSAVLLPRCQNGNGRHSTRVIIKGDNKTVVTNYTLSGAAFIDVDANVAQDTPTGSFERVAMADAYTVSNYDATVVDTDETPPGRITDVQVIDIHSGIPSVSMTRNYTITWTAPGDDFSEGQASAYEMRISDDPIALRHDFISAKRLSVNGSDMSPNVSGKVERLQMVVSSNDEFTATTYFAIVAIDDAGNRGDVSNIVPITIGLTSQFEVVEEECTDDCYAIVKDCGRSLTISNGHVNFTNFLTTAGSSVPVICDVGYIQNGGSSIECLENGTWSQAVTCKPVDCLEPAIDNGGLQTGSETVYNGSATVECDLGYAGGGTATCLDTGGWDTLPTCTPVDCGTPNVTNGNFTGETFYSGSATVFCDSGYDGTGIAICSISANWDILPECTPKNCGPLTVPNGVFSGDTVYAGNASITCNGGYDFSGIVKCGLDGQWATPAPRCSAKDCGDPREGNPDLIHSDLHGTTLFDASVFFQCHTGYEGGGSATCSDTGDWRQLPTCSPKDCGTPTTQNGNLTAESTTAFNGTAIVECFEGYEGGGAATCLSNATWDTLPMCTPVDCGTPTTPNGNLTAESTTAFNGTAVVECREGYEGGGAATCLSNATWDTLPVCTPIDCGTPDTPNGNLTAESTTVFRGTAVVECYEGYEGGGAATCLSNATWNILLPCTPIDCGRLTDPVHGSVYAPVTTYTSVATYTCQSLWRLNGSATRICVADGNWAPDPPTCDDIDCPSLKPPNDGSLVHVGTLVIVSCDHNYTLVGDGLIQCETGGIWNTTVGTCRRNCPVLTSPTNGNLSTTEVTEGTVVDITCGTAYTMEGVNQISCLPGGSWNDVLPNCTEDCQPLTIPDHGFVNTSMLSQGTIVSVECESGYTLFGATTLQCRTDATWDNLEPICKLDCPILRPPQNGKISTSFLSQSKVVTFSCNAGYTLFGGNQLTCQADSTWDLLEPVCKQDCPTLTHLPNGGFSTLESRQTTVTIAICKSGYSLFGATSLTCQSDATWDFPMPECKEVCPGVTPPTNGAINSTGVKQGTKVGVDCDTGYVLLGASLLICQSNATWDNPVPECRQDDVSKANDQMRIKNIVAITGSCVGLIFLVIIGLLMLTVIKNRRKRNLRKDHSREIPPDYMDESLEDDTTSANAFYGWYMYSKKGFEYLHPDRNLRDRPPKSNRHDIFQRYI